MYNMQSVICFLSSQVMHAECTIHSGTEVHQGTMCEQVPAGLGERLRSTDAVFQEQGIVYKSKAEDAGSTTLSRDVSYRIYELSSLKLARVSMPVEQLPAGQGDAPTRQRKYHVEVEYLVSDEPGQGIGIPN